MDAVAKHKALRDYYLSILERYRDELKNALPANIGVDRFTQVALITITKKPEIFSCTKASVIGAIMTSASLGLYIDDDLGECFIDRVYNDLTKKYEAQIIIGYQGSCVLGMRSGFVEYMQPRYVCEGDFFEYEYGLNDVLRHQPTAQDRGNDKITHFYIVVKLTAGSKIFNVMTRQEVEEVRDRSSFYKNAPKKEDTIWHIYFNKMGNKTVLRSLTKYIPLSPEMQLAVKLDEQLEYGVQDLSKQVIDMPGMDEDVLAEALEGRAQEQQDKTRKRNQDKTKKKVDEALKNLSGIVAKKSAPILAALFMFSSCDKEKDAVNIPAPKYCYECTKTIDYSDGSGNASNQVMTVQLVCDITDAQRLNLENSFPKQVYYNGFIASQSYKCVKR